MTSTQPAELCRISVFGPGGRADLAVPLSATVASLLPVLLRRTGGSATPQEGTSGWALQRLGDPPLDQSGTPESLEWRDGEELHLRPAAEPLPELDFDDVADGMAEAISQHRDRWRPECNKWLFLGLAITALIVFARALLYPGAPAVSTAGAGIASVCLLVAVFVVRPAVANRLLTSLLALAGCLFAGMASALAAAGVGGAASLSGTALLTGGLACASTGGLMLAYQAWCRCMSAVPFGVVFLGGVVAAVSQWLHLLVGLSGRQVAGLLAAALLLALIFLPRLAIRLARLPRPQLPWTAEQLQQDVAPLPMAEVLQRTVVADTVLTVVTVTAAITFGCVAGFLSTGGLFSEALEVLVSVAVLLRARAFQGIWQRVPLAAAGAVGLVLVVLPLCGWFGSQGRVFWFAASALVFVALVFAMIRAPQRRMLPIWGHLANIMETFSAVAVVPLLLQLFGVYGSVLGLVG